MSFTGYAWGPSGYFETDGTVIHVQTHTHGHSHTGVRVCKIDELTWSKVKGDDIVAERMNIYLRKKLIGQDVAEFNLLLDPPIKLVLEDDA